MVDKMSPGYQGSYQDCVTIFYLNRMTMLATCNLYEKHYCQFR